MKLLSLLTLAALVTHPMFAAEDKPAGYPAGGSALQLKVGDIIIPHVEFKQTTIEEAVRVMNRLAKEHDPKKVGILIEVTPAAVAELKGPIVDQAPKRIPLSKLVRSVAFLNNLSCEETPKGFRITTMSGK